MSFPEGNFGHYPKSKIIARPSVFVQKNNFTYSSSPTTFNSIIQANKEKQLLEFRNLLSKLLSEKKFSLFALQIRIALRQFPGNTNILALKKQSVIEDYQQNVLNQVRLLTENYFEKKPSAFTCEPGIVNTLGHQFVLGRINYVRRLAGVFDSCVFDPALNKRCQMAALMMDVNNKLDHAPISNWKCFSKGGASAASNSNLSLGSSFVDALMGQLEDNGSANSACGHRRWILNPYNNVFGHGSTYNAMALSVFGSADHKLVKKNGFVDSQFICWPSADYFPFALVPERWSFSLANADFSEAKVTVLLNGKPLNVRSELIKTGYAINTIVWIIDQPVQVNQTYSVKIARVRMTSVSGRKVLGKMKTYSYQFIPLQIL